MALALNYGSDGISISPKTGLGTESSISTLTLHVCQHHITTLMWVLCSGTSSHHLHFTRNLPGFDSSFSTLAQMRTERIVLHRIIVNFLVTWLLWKCLAGLTAIFILVLGIDITASIMAPLNNATRHTVQVIRVCELCLIRLMASITSEMYLAMSRSILEPP